MGIREIKITVRVHYKYFQENGVMKQCFSPQTENIVDLHYLKSEQFPLAEKYKEKILEKSLSRRFPDDYLLAETYTCDKESWLMHYGPDKLIDPEYFTMVEVISTDTGCLLCTHRADNFCEFYNIDLKKYKKRCVGFRQVKILKT